MLDDLEGTGLSRAELDAVRAAVGTDERCVAAFTELAGQGPYPARALARHPEWIEWIASNADRARDAETMRDELASRVLDDDQDVLTRELRRFKRRESLRIFLREVRGTVSMRETAAEIADLAEACLGVALSRLGELSEREEAASAMCVLGMGKLGGRELNFSSDIDLVFVCSDRAMTDESFRRDAIALGRELTHTIGAATPDGYVFRVDLRLRPDGSQGPLVQPVSALVDYYLQFGRTWERSAWLKARPVAGDLRLGEEVLVRLEPFLYRRYLAFDALEELRAMKEQIEANAQLAAVVGESETPEDAPQIATSPLSDRLKQKLSGARPLRRPQRVSAKPAPDADTSGVLGWDVKIGMGGIREIEFFVQALQLVHCGTRPQLRERNTLDALDLLLWAGLVPDDDHATLVDAYDFLRRLEHRIQMEEDRQAHRLPSRWPHFDRLAARLDTDRESLRRLIARHREGVRRIFERLFAPREERTEDVATLEPESPAAVELIMRADGKQLTSPSAVRALRDLGFARPRQVAGQIQVLREKEWGPLRSTVWGRDAVLARRILVEAAAAPDPDIAFSHFVRFAQAVGDRPGYWAMLYDNPHATRLLLQVFGSSAYLSGALIRDPNVFERLLAVGTVALEKTSDRMQDELRDRLDGVTDPEHRFGIVRRFHREETLRIGLHETGGAAKIRQSLDQLSLLAELVIDAVAREVYEPLRSRRRRPGSLLPPLDEIPFAVVAMGKLGGRELGFGSDLDIVFVYEEERQYRLDHTFYARFAQRLVRALSSASEDGKLYEVDTRLRPSGTQGALVVSLEAFSEYHENVARTWERQALVRARPIVGPSSLRRAIMDLRDELAFERPLPDVAFEEIRRMHAQLRERHYTRGTRDVKFGPGGMVDAEFMTQTMQLRHGGARDDAEPVRRGAMVDPGVRSQSTVRALEQLSDALDDPELRQVAEDYMFLARVQARVRMTADGTQQGAIADDDASLELLGRRTGHQGQQAAVSFRRALDAAMERIAAAFSRDLET